MPYACNFKTIFVKLKQILLNKRRRFMMSSKKVVFSLDNRVHVFKTGPVAQPVCPLARYFCQLAGKDKLSITDLYLIQKIGFEVKLLEND